MDQRCKLRATTLKHLEEYICVNVHLLGLGNGFLDVISKHMHMRKFNKLKFIKKFLKNASKDSIKKAKDNPLDE